MDDFSRLEPSEHMLHWLADDPYAAIRSEVESVLQKQVPGSQLTAFHVSSDPQWLTGARQSDADASKVILVRTGVAFEFVLSVIEPKGQSHELHGVFSWVGVNLDSNDSQQRIWFDLDETLTTCGAEGLLKSRMYFA